MAALTTQDVPHWLAEDLAARTAKREKRRQLRDEARAEADRVRRHTVPAKTTNRLRRAQRR